MFLPHTYDTAESQPWEYIPAGAAMTVEVGQLLTVSNGKLAAISSAKTNNPEYCCMARKTFKQDELVPVLRVHHGIVFQTTLSAAASGAKVGSKLEISAGGLEADATAAGTFELTYVDGTAKGDKVYGRFA